MNYNHLIHVIGKKKPTKNLLSKKNQLKIIKKTKSSIKLFSPITSLKKMRESSSLSSHTHMLKIEILVDEKKCA